MTNLEHYEEYLLKIWRTGDNFAIRKGNSVPEPCSHLNCNMCQFGSGNAYCKPDRFDWLQSDYVEYGVDWSRVPIDTPIRVSIGADTDIGTPRYYAGIDDSTGKPSYYMSGCTSYTNAGALPISIDETKIKLAIDEDQYKYRKESVKCNLMSAE